MEKEKLREIVKKSVEEVWFNRRSMNPVADQTEFLTEALHQALSMSGVRTSCFKECWEMWLKCDSERAFVQWLHSQLHES